MCFLGVFFTCPRLVAAYQLREVFFLSQSDEGLFFSHNYKIENEPSESFFFPLVHCVKSVHSYSKFILYVLLSKKEIYFRTYRKKKKNVYWSAFGINRMKMLNNNIKSEEPLKIVKTISGSSLGLYLLNFAKEVP